MFNALTGTLLYKGLDVIHLENQGIEWEIYMAPRFISELGAVGTTVRVLLWLFHKEDSMRLYGFPGEKERKLFLELIKVNGIGPKQALKILSGIRPDEMETVLAHGDVHRLEKIPGIGKKTAQNILVNLQGVLALGSSHDSIQKTTGYEDLVLALADLGYEKKRCIAVIENLLQEHDFLILAPEEREQWLFHKALILLSTGKSS